MIAQKKIIKLIPAQVELRKHATLKNKNMSEFFFKTALGQYGFGDQFIGVKVPQARMVAKNFKDLTFSEIKILLNSPVHEDRTLAVMILREQYESAVKSKNAQLQKKIFNFYIKSKSRINNWDLVDGSAPYVSGHYIFEHPIEREKVFALINSKRMWDRRIAMLSTYYFIRHHEFKPTIQLAHALLDDKEDLMHKASGWMLREMGKKDLKQLLGFLDLYCTKMPRTMLRYSIEKLTPKQRIKYLKK